MLLANCKRHWWSRRELNLSSETCIFIDVFKFSKEHCHDYAPKCLSVTNDIIRIKITFYVIH